jgi:hypothetical protein
MMRRRLFPIGVAMTLVALSTARLAGATDQTSATYRVVADVFTGANPALACQSYDAKAGLSVAQVGVVGYQASPSYRLELGYQAASEGFDTDADGIPDADDPDTDGDGLANALDTPGAFGTSAYLTDSDNDGQDDYQEWIAGTAGNDPNDRFRVQAIERSTGASAALRWRGVAGRRYAIEGATNLLSAAAWKARGATNLTVSGDTTFADTNAAPSRLHYRVKASLVP